MNFTELEQSILEWAEEKQILQKATPLSQLTKTKEEIEEIEECLIHLSKGNKKFVDSKGRVNETLKSAKLEIGDSLVTILILSKLLNVDVLECLELAYEKIKDRQGFMKNGIFVKKSL